MTRLIFPIVLAAAAIGIFYFFTDPYYKEVQALTQEKASYEQALDNSKRLQAKRDELRERFNAFPVASIERLERMVPNNVDNVRLVLELDRMAAKYGMSVKNIRLDSKADRNKERDLIGASDKPFGSVSLEFAVDGPYRNFVSFMEDLEKSLRVVDIESVSFSVSGDLGVSQHNVRIKTYWLK
ncbi:MAG: type 4a pilus biogenesis protein PilO [bacterium]|nr:type 4a pilus biogenesis protein PilO [bacterium]